MRVGRTRSLFYHYFPKKGEDIDAARNEVIDRFTEQVQARTDHVDLNDIDGALTECSEMIKSLVLQGMVLGPLLDADTGDAAKETFEQRTAGHRTSYVSETTLKEFVVKHELSLEHEYETPYVLIAGLILLFDQHPETPTEAIKTIIDSTLHLKERVINAR